jgi:hypothetical protein
VTIAAYTQWALETAGPALDWGTAHPAGAGLALAVFAFVLAWPFSAAAVALLAWAQVFTIMERRALQRAVIRTRLGIGQ